MKAKSVIACFVWVFVFVSCAPGTIPKFNAPLGNGNEQTGTSDFVDSLDDNSYYNDDYDNDETGDVDPEDAARFRVIAGYVDRNPNFQSQLQTAAQAENKSEALAALLENRELELEQAVAEVLTQLALKDTSQVTAFRYMPFFTAEVDNEDLAKLYAGEQITSIEMDEVMYLTSTGGSLTAGVKEARNYFDGYDGTGTVVAVIDTGVDTAHPALAGKVVAEACYSSNSGDDISLCPGGVVSSTAAGSGKNCDAAVEGCGHGTAVAAVATGGAVADLALDGGIAPGADLIAVNVAHEAADDTAKAYQSNILFGLERVLALAGEHNVAAVNLSLGSGQDTFAAACDDDYPASLQAVQNLLDVGIFTVAATGNAGLVDQVSAPACLSNVVSVGNGSHEIEPSSNRASFVSVFAPGGSIETAAPNSETTVSGGTSIAGAYTTGAIAIWQQAAAAHPARSRPSLTGFVAKMKQSPHRLVDTTGIVYSRLDVMDVLRRITTKENYIIRLSAWRPCGREFAFDLEMHMSGLPESDDPGFSMSFNGIGNGFHSEDFGPVAFGSKVDLKLTSPVPGGMKCDVKNEIPVTESGIAEVECYPPAVAADVANTLLY